MPIHAKTRCKASIKISREDLLLKLNSRDGVPPAKHRISLRSMVDSALDFP